MKNVLDVIKAQLERDISGFHKIECSCKYGFPQVISTYPMLNGKLFPTLYWLTCPFIKKQIGRLEEQGMIRIISERINTSSTIKQKYINETRIYINKRMELFKEIHPEKKIPDRIKNSGIGGIQNWKDLIGIKCLHLHFAYYLVDSNEMVGNMIKDRISLTCYENKCLSL